MDGAGVPRDVGEARRWLELSAEQDYAAAQYKLGWLYSNGGDLSQDLSKAASWFRLAAQQGEPLALYALGVMTATGRGVPPDAVAAFAFLTLSAGLWPTVLRSRLDLGWRRR